MGVLDSLLAGGIKGVADGVGGLAISLRTAFTGEAPIDPNKRAEILMQVEMLNAAAVKAAADYDTAQMQGQLKVNEVEAQSDSLWKSGWRPGVGWVCVLGLFYEFLVRPILPWMAHTWAGAWGAASVVEAMPEIAMGDLLVILGGILGIGTMRSVERIKGVAK